MQDHDLWEQYQEDFAGFIIQHFKDANTFNTRNLRATLREHGVWVKKDRGSILPKALYDALQEKQLIE
jgi:ribosomal protein L10